MSRKFRFSFVAVLTLLAMFVLPQLSMAAPLCSGHGHHHHTGAQKHYWNDDDSWRPYPRRHDDGIVVVNRNNNNNIIILPTGIVVPTVTPTPALPFTCPGSAFFNFTVGTNAVHVVLNSTVNPTVATITIDGVSETLAVGAGGLITPTNATLLTLLGEPTAVNLTASGLTLTGGTLAGTYPFTSIGCSAL